MLKAHIAAVEKALLATSQIPANSGHPLHKGTPREAFIRTFLEGHLSERVAIGTGEIFDATSQPGGRRNQHDIVIYRRDFPRLDFGGGVTGYFAESVVATIEVKSILDQEGLRKAMVAARASKQLSRNLVTSFTAGHQPPGILSYVVAYDGPATMQTVYGWIGQISASEGITYPELPISDAERTAVASPSVDAVVVLGKGFVHFGNAPVGFFTSEMLEKEKDARWVTAETPDGNLLLLFLLLTTSVSGASASWLDPMPYVKSFSVKGAVFGP